jgi:hypothetical protein
MHSPVNYLIFWLPPGYDYDNPQIDQGYANSSNANYEAAIGRYLHDVSSTEYYYILQQYTDSSGPPGINATLGGSWVDVSPYPGSEGTKANPLHDSDLQNEVEKAIAANGWSAGGGNNAFFVFTGYDVFGCAGSTCSYNGYCAYHSAYTEANGQNVVYADIPDPGSQDVGSCLATDVSGFHAPNGGAFADSAINLVAHEEFESATDPVFDGWYYQDMEHEIADECAWKLGSVAPDGGNIGLNGHRYLVQEMWSNELGACFLPSSVTTLQVAASYQVLGGGSGFAPPTLTFFSNGVLQHDLLTSAPQTLSIDLGTAWDVTVTLGGSSMGERWQTPQTTTGVLQNGGTLSFTYYHQFLASFGFGVAGGGAGYSAPALTVTQFGSTTSVTATGGGLKAWVDAQSKYNYAGQLPGSTTGERWAAAQSANGSVSSSNQVSVSYYHQYLVPVSYSFPSGGNFVSSPPSSLSYFSLGQALNASLGTQPRSVWLDVGTKYSATSPLPGSTATERWFAPGGDGTVSSAVPLALAYYHQYFLSVQGSVAQSAWYNSSTQATITITGAYDRSQGAGLRVTGYQLDGGALQTVSPRTGPVSLAVQMDQPHALVFTTVTQYQVSLDSGASSALASMTPPTVPGDDYWYDSGSDVTLVLNGVWGRGPSSGDRLVSYAVDGGAAVGLDTTGQVTVLSSSHIDSPQSVTTTAVVQYQLLTGSGSILSMTGPSVPGDAGWYDSGAEVNLSYNYVWNVTQGSRLNAVRADVDGVPSQLARSGTGTFQEEVMMDKSHALDVVSVTQHPVVVMGGFRAATSPGSPTNDTFYDSGSSVSVSSARTWKSTSLSREALVSYSIDGGGANPVPDSDSGDFATPPLMVVGPHLVAFGSATQFFMTFKVTDASGATRVAPTLLEIDTTQPLDGTVDVQGSGAWLDAGSSFVVGQLKWENTDVRPLNQTVAVNAPQNVTIAARIYPVTLKVTDYLQVPISGAAANIELVNGTMTVRTTASDGTISMNLVPLGRFNGTVSYSGISQEIAVDAAAQHNPVEVRFFVSGPDFGALVGGVVAAFAVGYLVLRRRPAKKVTAG